MVQISITRDSDTGIVSGKIMPENKLLEDYFESEVQNDTGFIRHLRKKLLELADAEVEMIGNAYYLTLNADSYTIRSLFEDDTPSISGPTGDFLFLLNQWYDFLLNETS